MEDTVTLESDNGKQPSHLASPAHLGYAETEKHSLMDNNGSSGERAHCSGGVNSNSNNNHKPDLESPAAPVQSASRVFQEVRANKKIAQNPTEKLKYLAKPMAFAAIGFSLTCVGVALTASHFLYEDSLSEDVKNPPYFTFGPVTFATGLIVTMIGVVWFSQKHHKWATGTAAPIVTAAAAAAAQLVTSATMSSEQMRTLPREPANGGVHSASAVA